MHSDRHKKRVASTDLTGKSTFSFEHIRFSSISLETCIYHVQFKLEQAT